MHRTHTGFLLQTNCTYPFMPYISFSCHTSHSLGFGVLCLQLGQPPMVTSVHRQLARKRFPHLLRYFQYRLVLFCLQIIVTSSWQPTVRQVPFHYIPSLLGGTERGRKRGTMSHGMLGSLEGQITGGSHHPAARQRRW